MSGKTSIGIDVSKATLDICLLVGRQQHEGRFSNDASGFSRLASWLGQHDVKHAHVCLEATGAYGEEVAHFLYSQGFDVSVVNPLRIKKYAQSQLRRNKTDKLDARVIADFCKSQKTRLWSLPDPAWRELRDLVRLRDDLLSMRQQERNRLQAGVWSPVVVISLKQHIAFLDQQIKDIDSNITNHINRHPDLKHKRDLLVSIPGIGHLTAAKLLAEVRDFLAFDNVRQLVAFAGLNPQANVSGSSLHSKSFTSKMGNSAIRHALYWPAICARTRNPLIKSLCQRLEQEGHPPMVAIVASMRKLLHLAYGVLKNDTPFNPDYLLSDA